MTADPRPPRRIVDPDAYREFHAQNLSCVSCGLLSGMIIEAHHVLLKSRGGDDTVDNLVALCRNCHRAFHGTPYMDMTVRIDSGWVRFKIARWLESDEGAACRAYLVGKLGRGPAAYFLQREFGLREAVA
jgi:5-methylcytosine-specific restriction endonuclease McrA